MSSAPHGRPPRARPWQELLRQRPLLSTSLPAGHIYHSALFCFHSALPHSLQASATNGHQACLARAMHLLAKSSRVTPSAHWGTHSNCGCSTMPLCGRLLLTPADCGSSTNPFRVRLLRAQTVSNSNCVCPTKTLQGQVSSHPAIQSRVSPPSRR